MTASASSQLALPSDDKAAQQASAEAKHARSRPRHRKQRARRPPGPVRSPGAGAAPDACLPQAGLDEVSLDGQQAARAHAAGRGEAILLVDDDTEVLKVGRKMLESLGFRVLPASGGQEALQIAQSYAGKIDLLLTDVDMPGMDGFTLKRRLSALLPSLKCIFASGYVSPSLRQADDCPEDGAILEKPFTRAQLAERVRGALVL